ncbi:MAG: hypothetical protein FJ253_02845 [Phycisphaerae bacterium]|nr:hypothetical protein [Phycisphaerae bacterium]
MTYSIGRSIVPARVRAALDYLSYCESVTHTCDVTVPARSLSALETSVAQAALRVLSSYFNGEMDYGDRPPTLPDDDCDDGPPSPVPEPTPTA